MRDVRTLLVTTRAEWRRWLARNHAVEAEIWLVIFKKHTGKPSLAYENAVEEALCYGWIDSIVRRRDDETYIQKFTPRRAGSKWSVLNVQRVRKMIREQRMTAAGLAVLGNALEPAQSAEMKVPAKTGVVPADIRKAISTDKQAAVEFKKLPPGYVRMCLKWIDAAKRAETRARRIQEFVLLTAQGQRIGMK